MYISTLRGILGRGGWAWVGGGEVGEGFGWGVERWVRGLGLGGRWRGG